MSDKDYIEFSKKLDEGLLLAEKRMLQEKALHDESVVVCDNDNKIKRIPAKQIISENVIFQQVASELGTPFTRASAM